MEENKREIGGSRLSIWYGKLLGRISKYYQIRSEKHIIRGSKTIVSNPTCKFANPFTLLFNFTVDNTEKYQLVHQGNFKTQYKEWRDRVDLYNDKKLIYDSAILEYEALGDKTGVDAPILPTLVGDSPIGTKEMFMVILPKKKFWFKKI